MGIFMLEYQLSDCAKLSKGSMPIQWDTVHKGQGYKVQQVSCMHCTLPEMKALSTVDAACYVRALLTLSNKKICA